MREAAPFGTVDAACANLVQMADAVITHANLIRHYEEIRFFPGMDYSARCLRAYLRALDQAHAEVGRSREVASNRQPAELAGAGAR